jgi:CubicO group peptidase (beta-lactamase class C family)
MINVQGHVTPGFEGVRDAFAGNFETNGEVGAAFALYVRGEKVVDLWGGVADVTTDRPWEEDTMVLVHSTTKGVTAICAHLLAQRGQLDLDAPVATYWPEFKAEGKESIPVRWLLGHRAGLPVIDGTVTPDEVYAGDTVVERLAAQKPVWEPGTAHGYHTLTYGSSVGEVVRRVTGMSIGQFLATEIAGPLGIDVFIGLPEEEERRVSPLIELDAPIIGAELPEEVLAQLPEDIRAMVEAFSDPNSLSQRSLNMITPPLDVNSREMHAAEIPAGGGIATARGLAKLYAACVGDVDGRRVLEPATVADATREQSNGPDRVIMVDTRFGSGFFLPTATSPMLGASSFGHAGMGGSLAFADVDAHVGFGYVMNKMNQDLFGDPRTLSLIDAVKAAL